MKTEDALKLARLLKFGPGVVDSKYPLPSREEALALIRQEQKTCGFNWLTGAAAVEALEGKEKL